MYQENTQIYMTSLNHNNNLNTVTSRNPENLSWLRIRIKSVNQLTSLIAPLLILIASGINSLWDRLPQYILVSIDFGKTDKLLGSVLWLIGGIFGAIFAAILVHQIRKIIIYRISCLTLFISGILFIAFYTYSKYIYGGIFLGGFCYGLTFVTAIIHASEISIKQLRGWFVTGLVFSTLIGKLIMFILEMYKLINIKEMNYSVISGILILIVVFLSLNFLDFWSLESPAFLIEKHNKVLASETLLKLRKEIEETSETQEDFLELNEMVNARTTNSNIFAIFIIILSRIFFNSMPGVLRIHGGFNFAFLGSCIIGVILSILLIEKLGRKYLLIISNIITGLFIFSFSISRLIHSEIFADLLVIGILATIFFIFMGIGLSVSATYLTEIFPFKFKSYLIAFTIIAENLIYIMFKYCVYISFVESFGETIIWLLIGFVMIFIGILSIFFLPETKSLSLNECSKRRK